jgi:hypothetical protein
MNPNDSPLYAGIAGVSMSVNEFDFGKGVVLKETYAHIMTPYLAAFAPAKPDCHHPGPWKTVSGGGFDITVELYVPLELVLQDWFDRINTVWWFAALLRLVGSSLARVPLIADMPFAQIPLSQNEPCFWPIEMKTPRFVRVGNARKAIHESDLRWIRDHWLSAGGLMNKREEFNIAVQAIDACTWSHSASLALVSLWGALERLFSPSYSELSFRVSATIASYLEPPGEDRVACYRRVKKLYDARSKAAHGSPLAENESLLETYDLLKRVLVKIIEENDVPSRETLEGLLFGAG